MNQTAKILPTLVDGQAVALRNTVEMMKALGTAIGIRAQGESDLAKVSAIATECGAYWEAVKFNVAGLTPADVKDALYNGVWERIMPTKTVDMLSCIEELPEIVRSLATCADYCKAHRNSSPAWLFGDDDATDSLLEPTQLEYDRLESAVLTLQQQAAIFELSAVAFTSLVGAFATQSLEELYAASRD